MNRKIVTGIAFAVFAFTSSSGQDDADSQIKAIGERLGAIEKRLASLEGSAAASAGQGRAAADPIHTTDVVEIKGDVSRAESLVSVVEEIVVRRIDGSPAMLALRGPESAVAAARKLIEQYDKAPRAIEVTIHLLEGKHGGEAVEVPEALRPVATELTDIFGFDSFSLRDTIVLRTREGQGGTSSGLLSPSGESSTDGETPYRVSFELARIEASGQGLVVKLDSFSVDYRVTYTSGTGDVESENLELSTSLDVKVGQQVVVGKGRPNGANRGAQFAVVSVEVLD